MENNSQIPILTPHEYPLWIRASGFFVILLFLCTTPIFLFYELPEHKSLSARIKQANRLFNKAAYEDAITLYAKIHNDYPSYKQANIQIAKAFFALSESKAEFYEYGLFLLNDQTFSEKEFEKIASYVPAQFKDDFLSNFEEVKKA